MLKKTEITKRILKINKLKEQGKNVSYLDELEKFKKELETAKRNIEEGIAIVTAKINKAP
jgi:flagellin-like hook-associated protein FlgL